MVLMLCSKLPISLCPPPPPKPAASPSKKKHKTPNRILLPDARTPCHNSIQHSHQNVQMSGHAIPLADESWRSLSITNQLLLEEATRRGWRIDVLSEGSTNMIVFHPNDGEAPIVVQRARTELGSAIGSRLATDKAACASLLEVMGLPTALSLRAVVRNGEFREGDKSAMATFVGTNQVAGCATVVKPTDGAHGEGVVLSLAPPREDGTDAMRDGLNEVELADLTAAARHAISFSPSASGKKGASRGTPVLLQRMAAGTEMRVLVLAGGVFAAAIRSPPTVVGDGERSLLALLEQLNDDPNRGEGHTHPRSLIDPAAVSAYLGPGELGRIPEEGEVVELLGISNLSAGGNAVDVTDKVHPEIKALCVRVAHVLSLDLAGIDLMVEDMTAPLDQASVVVLEVNVSPGARMHAFPSTGTPRNVAPFIFDAILAKREASSLTTHALRQAAAVRRSLRMLVVMDHATSKEGNSLWPLLRALAAHPAAEGVYVASRYNPANRDFFYPPHSASSVHVHKVGPKYGFKPLAQVSFADALPMELSGFDSVLLRLSRPVTRAFLDGIGSRVPEWRVINGLSNVLRVGSKAWLTHIPDLCPPLAHCTSVEDVEAFRAQHGPMVLKPVQDGGGSGITRVDGEGRVFVEHAKDGVEWEQYVDEFLGPQLGQSGNMDDNDGGEEEEEEDHDLMKGMLAMRFLKNVSEGDKRTIVVNGRIIGSSLRRPQEGNWVCNAHMGGTSHHTEPDQDEIELIQTLDRRLRGYGIAFYGIDTLVNDDGVRVLSEVNVFNVGGMHPMELVSGAPVVGRCVHALWEYVVQRTADHEGWVM